MSEVVEDYNEAAVALAESEAAQAATAAEHERLAAEVATLSGLAEDHVRRMHKLGPSLELSSIFVAGNPADAGAKAATLRRVLAGQRADIERLAAERARQAAEEERRHPARQPATAPARRSTPAPAEPDEPTPPPAPSTRRSAQTAVDTALAQVGKPYRYGGRDRTTSTAPG